MTRSSQAIVKRSARMESTNSRKLAPTAECCGLDALETVNTSTGETTRDDELPDDLWLNLNAMVTNMVSIAISGLVLRVTARRSCIECT